MKISKHLFVELSKVKGKNSGAYDADMDLTSGCALITFWEKEKALGMIYNGLISI